MSRSQYPQSQRSWLEYDPAIRVMVGDVEVQQQGGPATRVKTRFRVRVRARFRVRITGKDLRRRLACRGKRG